MFFGFTAYHSVEKKKEKNDAVVFNRAGTKEYRLPRVKNCPLTNLITHFLLTQRENSAGRTVIFQNP